MDTGRFQIYWVLKTKTFHTKWQVNLAFTYKPVVAQSLSRVRLFGTPWTAAHQASLSISISWSLLKLMFIDLVMPSNHLILCRRLLLLPSIFPSIRDFSRESALSIWWPKYWSFNFFSTSPSNGYSGLISWNKTECGRWCRSQQWYRESQRQTRLFKIWHMAYHFLDPG